MCALSWSAAAAGNYAYAPNWSSNVTSPWRPEAFTSDVKLPLFFSSVDYASGTLGLGLA